MVPSDGKTDLEALEIFEQSLDQPVENRAQWIRETAGDNEEVCNKALSYLSRDSDANSVINTGGAFYETLDDTMIPDQIGAYLISGVIGRGGMGAVYRGKRANDDFDHEVAIKVVRPGALSKALVTRFESERQTLAKLSHPNIARLYDGGTIENGSPYIVMEYIDGMPITDWADKNNLSKEDRLNLFRTTCKAIGYAHQNLIIHRDITPSNILVDDMGEVKIIDFGIAKPFGADSIETEENYPPIGLSLTPGFAAPERAHIAEANTLTDIYSLGKLLEAILGSHKDNELTAIIEKATSKEPKDRYDMVSSLEEDIKRYQNHFPVQAVLSSSRYTLKKFIERHKVSTSFVTVMIVGLFAAFAITINQYQNANDARIQADTRFNETRALTNFLITDIDSGLNTLPGSLDLKRQVNEVSAEYINILSEAVKTDKSLEFEYALARAQLGSLLTDEGGRNLYDPVVGLEHFEISLEILERLAAAPNAPVEIKRALADIHMKCAYLYRFYFNDISKLYEVSEIAEPIYQELLSDDPTNTEVKTALLHLQFERWTADFQNRSKKETLESLKAHRETFNHLLRDDFSNYTYIVNYSGVLSLFTDYAERKWNAPFDPVPISDKEEYQMILDWIEYSFNIAKERIEQNSTNPEDMYNYFWGLETLVIYSTMNLEWRPSIYNLQTDFGNDINNDPEFDENYELAQKLFSYVDTSDHLLRLLQPFEDNIFSYQEAYYENIKAKALIQMNLSFDLEKAETNLMVIIDAIDEYLLEEPNDEYIRNQGIEIRLLQSILLTAENRLSFDNSSGKICSILIEVDKTITSRSLSIGGSASGKQQNLLQSLKRSNNCVIQ